jgi:undecaprenyl diphosphate synthase
LKESEKGPIHVAIIMDGNGRWAKKRGLIRSAGHERGGNQVRTILKEAYHMGVKQLTLYAFSSENWKRPKAEVMFLHNLLVKFLKSETEQLNKDNVYFSTIGDLSKFPKKVTDAISNSKEALSKNDGITLCLALNYGSRPEITEACKNIAIKCVENPELVEKIDEEMVNDNLFTKGMPELDLLIRTAGEQRISNFLLWQLSYAELYFTDCFWPDFTPEELAKALNVYRSRERRFGGL